MARRKAERPAERGGRRAETNVVAAYPTALKAPKVPARSRDALMKRRAQIEQWIAEEPSPIREVELIQQRLDIDAQLVRLAARGGGVADALVARVLEWAREQWARFVRLHVTSDNEHAERPTPDTGS